MMHLCFSQLRISDIFYLYPFVNVDDSQVTYIITKIEDDKLMFQCHTTYNFSTVIELYVCLLEQVESSQVIHLTLPSQTHQYQMS